VCERLAAGGMKNFLGHCRANVPDRTMYRPVLFLIVLWLTLSGCARKQTNARAISPPLAAVPKAAAEKGARQDTAQAAQTSMAPSSSAGGNGSNTITGCLGGSNGPAPYSLLDERGRRYAVRGTKDLDNHGRQVRLTGSAAGMTFNATKVEELARACL
jgi:hypothetical protein